MKGGRQIAEQRDAGTQRAAPSLEGSLGRGAGESVDGGRAGPVAGKGGNCGESDQEVHERDNCKI